MSKNSKYFGKREEKGVTAQDPNTPVIDGLEMGPGEPLQKNVDGIAPGQVYEGVKVPDRKINIMGLTPGAVLGPLVIEAPYTDTNDGWWFAFFEGEGCTGIKLYVDAEMLRSGKLRK